MASTTYTNFQQPAIQADWLNDVNTAVYGNGFIQTGAGAGPRTILDKMRESVSVTDFYANGVNGARVDPTGAIDSTAGIQAAIAALPASGGWVHFPPGTFKISSTIRLRTGVTLCGSGSQATTLSWVGAGGTAIAQATPGTQIFGVGVRGLRIFDSGTGALGMDLNSVAVSEFDDVLIAGFTTGLTLTGVTNGDCVYNRFYNVTVSTASSGYVIGPLGSNSNSFTSCRANVCSVVGFDIIDSNQNMITQSQIEICPIGIRITATNPASADHNVIAFNRFELCPTNYSITSTNVRYTYATGNAAFTGTSIDNGLRSTLLDLYSTTSLPVTMKSANVASAQGAFRFVRESQGGAGLPALVIRDDASAAGTPVTLQIETERFTGKFLSGLRGGNELAYINANGAAMLSGTAPVVAAGQVGIGATVSSTVGAAGGAAALPATPVGYLIVNIAGTNRQIPYYNV